MLNSRRFVCFVIPTIASIGCLTAQVQAKTSSDVESGTLVIITQTKSAVIVSVDSQISTDNGFLRAPSIWTDGSRKLVDVGRRGACALDGWIGNEQLYLAPAASLRYWAKKHPAQGPAGAIDNLLVVAAKSWDDMGKKPGELLPNSRQVGDAITTLLCGDFVDGQPVIVRGETYVKSDFTAGYRKLPPELGDVLYVDGAIQTWELPILFSYPPSLLHLKIQSQNLPALMKISSDLQSNPTAKDSFRDVQAIQAAGLKSPMFILIWKTPIVQNLFKSLYQTVEQNYPDIVGAPNNVRIITSCGRLNTTIEADPWPTCPIANLPPRSFPTVAPPASAR